VIWRWPRACQGPLSADEAGVEWYWQADEGKQPMHSFHASPQPLHLGQHVLSITDDKGSQLDLLASAFRDALSEGCQCVYIGDQVAGTAFVDSFAARGCDLSEPSRTGQFRGLSPDQVYTRDGRFDVERVLQGLWDAIEVARRDGFAGLFAAGEAAWIWQGIPGVDRFLEYEHGINLIENRDSAVLICLYDSRRTSPWLESELLKCHPTVHDGSQVTGSAQFIPGPVELADVPLLEELEPPADSLSCGTLSELLSSYADGELLDRRADEVARHLATCSRCASAVEGYRQMKRAASAIGRPAAVPDGLWDRVRAQLDEDCAGD
jgi:hypothetical protein